MCWIRVGLESDNVPFITGILYNNVGQPLTASCLTYIMPVLPIFGLELLSLFFFLEDI